MDSNTVLEKILARGPDSGRWLGLQECFRAEDRLHRDSRSDCLIGLFADSRAEFDLAYELKEFAFHEGLDVAVENARSLVFKGHPAVKLCSTYGGAVTRFARWETPLSVESAQEFLDTGLEVSMSRRFEIQVRFPLPNPFRPRYELLVFEHRINQEFDYSTSREAVVFWTWNRHMDFARLICRWWATIDDGFPFELNNWRPLERSWHGLGEPDEETRNAYLAYWGERGFVM